MDRKRVKLQDARQIAVQSSDKALRAGEINVNAFVEARKFEIKALEDSMAKTK